MRTYRKIYRCEECGKVYRNKKHLRSFSGTFFTDYICRKCGSIDKINPAVGKPRILGWVVKEENGKSNDTTKVYDI